MEGLGFCGGRLQIGNPRQCTGRSVNRRNGLTVVSALAPPPRSELTTVESTTAADNILEEITQSTLDENELPMVYDVEGIARYWSRRPLQVQKRLLMVSSLLTPYILNGILASKTNMIKEDSARRRRRAEEFRNILSKLGPAYIKLGQGLSVRPDLVGPEVMEELQKLCDNVPAFDNETAMLMIEEELGRPANEIFKDMSPNPIAAASLGQVYKARLAETGEAVAVKVQRPDMLRKVSLDMYVMRKIFGAAQVLQDATSNAKTEFIPLFDEWAAGTYRELDYVNEGKNGMKFRDQITSRVAGIAVPDVKFQATSRKVLTTGWVNGIKLVELPDDKLNDKVRLGVQCFLTQLLDTGFFHADPHPGNLMVNEKDELVVLDFGLMSEVRSGQSDVFVAAIIHLGNRDYEAVVEDFIELDFLNGDVDRKRVVPVLGAILDQALEGGGAKSINFQTLSSELSQVTFDFPFRIPPYAALVIRALGVLEGIALTGDPKFKMIMEAFPYVSKRVMSTDTPLLRKAFRDIVYVDGVFSAKRLQVLLDSSAGFLGDGDAFVDFDTPSEEAMDPTESLKFLNSEDGQFLRSIIADEIAASLDVVARSSTMELKRRIPAPLRALPFVNVLNLVPDLSKEEIVQLENVKEIVKFLSNRQISSKNMTQETLRTLLPELGNSASDIGVQVAGQLSELAVRRAFDVRRSSGEVVAGRKRFPQSRLQSNLSRWSSNLTKK
ncbi:hypothetical protein NDN08_002848 [Rhodosorus marinus]|uniref:Protein kinase domain-containing protein n=1 Tax=Rhodosorus marinus TaxID=101924 RepID=A0AAV8UUY8_9RHOD|nr:hypothetical protein NDN08_002848 [Rhodosorus marinus]